MNADEARPRTQRYLIPYYVTVVEWSSGGAIFGRLSMHVIYWQPDQL
jgi:hypothetical protein